MEVLFKTRLGFRLFIFSLRFFRFFEAIAHAMILPVSQTDPTELVLALPASHVVAPPVLFDWPIALHTVLSVHFYPIKSFGLRLALLLPLHHLLASRRDMALAWTELTNREPTEAPQYLLLAFHSYQECTVGLGTPLPAWVQLYKAFGEELAVLLENFSIDVLFNKVGREQRLAGVLHALDVVGDSLLYVAVDVLHSALVTEDVLTC